MPKDRGMQVFLTAAVRYLASHTSPVIATSEMQLSGVAVALTAGMLLASSSYCRKRPLEIDDSATRENAQFTHAVQIRIQEAVRRLILILITWLVARNRFGNPCRT